MRRRNKGLAVLFVLALIGGGASTAYAAIPDGDDGEYHMCVPDAGPLKVPFIIDKQAGTNCPAGYSEKTWDGDAPPAPSLETERVQQSFEVPAQSMKLEDVACPEGTTVTGGGYAVGSSTVPGFDFAVDGNVPGLMNGSPNGWKASVKNFEDHEITAQVHAVCASLE